MTANGTPCWADLWTTDVEGSRSFYSSLFGWQALAPAAEFGGYWMFERNQAPVAGGMGSMGDMVANNTWKPYFSTDDIEGTVKRAEAAGATIQGPGVMAVADIGVQAVLLDPTGAELGLWQPGTFAGFQVFGRAGAPGWFELNTRSHGVALDFYREVFGWDVETVVDTDELRYFTVKGGASGDLIGIADTSSWVSEGGDHWSIYWHVDDAVAAAELVQTLGGSVTQGPDSTPYGVLATVADPAGARFKLRANG